MVRLEAFMTTYPSSWSVFIFHVQQHTEWQERALLNYWTWRSPDSKIYIF